MRDWLKWHHEYDDPTTSLSRRLQVVRGCVAQVLAEGAVRRILSLCAGDGRDLIPVLATEPPELRPEVTLVELDGTLAARAQQGAASAGVQVSVIAGDAGVVQTWRSATPVDLLMLCGVLGNISDEDARATIRAVPGFLNVGGTVLWTRGHRSGADLRPETRRWFLQAGLQEVTFDSEEGGFGVGVNRLCHPSSSAPPPERLFEFLR